MAAVLSLIYIVQVLVGDPWLLRRAGRARTAPLPVVLLVTLLELGKKYSSVNQIYTHEYTYCFVDFSRQILDCRQPLLCSML